MDKLLSKIESPRDLQALSEADLEQLARHITRFSLEGLKAYARPDDNARREGAGPLACAEPTR